MAAWFINLLNWLISGLGAVLSALLSVLPDSPFTILDTSPIAPYLATINFFVPVSEVIATCELWLASIAIYYTYQAVLRILKFES